MNFGNIEKKIIKFQLKKIRKKKNVSIPKPANGATLIFFFLLLKAMRHLGNVWIMDRGKNTLSTQTHITLLAASSPSRRTLPRASRSVLSLTCIPFDPTEGKKCRKEIGRHTQTTRIPWRFTIPCRRSTFVSCVEGRRDKREKRKKGENVTCVVKSKRI